MKNLFNGMVALALFWPNLAGAQMNGAELGGNRGTDIELTSEIAADWARDIGGFLNSSNANFDLLNLTLPQLNKLNHTDPRTQRFLNPITKVVREAAERIIDEGDDILNRRRQAAETTDLEQGDIRLNQPVFEKIHVLADDLLSYLTPQQQERIKLISQQHITLYRPVLQEAIAKTARELGVTSASGVDNLNPDRPAVQSSRSKVQETRLVDGSVLRLIQSAVGQLQKGRGRALDGDSFYLNLNGGVSFRLDKVTTVNGEEARRFLQSKLIQTKFIEPVRFDEFGRIVCNVRIDAGDLAALIAKNGFAHNFSGDLVANVDASGLEAANGPADFESNREEDLDGVRIKEWDGTQYGLKRFKIQAQLFWQSLSKRIYLKPISKKQVKLLKIGLMSVGILLMLSTAEVISELAWLGLIPVGILLILGAIINADIPIKTIYFNGTGAHLYALPNDAVEREAVIDIKVGTLSLAAKKSVDFLTSLPPDPKSYLAQSLYYNSSSGREVNVAFFNGEDHFDPSKNYLLLDKKLLVIVEKRQSGPESGMEIITDPSQIKSFESQFIRQHQRAPGRILGDNKTRSVQVMPEE